MSPHRRWLLAVALMGVVPGRAAEGAEPWLGAFRGARYCARWTASVFELRTPAGRTLTRWPVGAACSNADPRDAALPVPRASGVPPRHTRTADRETLTWHWRLPPPWPFSEQTETYALLRDRVEVRARVRLRPGLRPPRWMRMVYGASLAPGWIDLEGLWETREEGAWVAAPVPGVTTHTGDVAFRRAVDLRGMPGNLVLGLEGVDEGDTASVAGVEVGRTPSSAARLSWTIPRRYAFAAPPADGPVPLEVTVSNAAGNGGLWRGPCVLGPTADRARRDPWRRATVRGRALYHWCPDAYEAPLTGRFTVSLTSVDRTRDAVPENVTTGGRFLLPPYVIAIEGAAGWWGIGTLDVPRAEDGLRVEYRAGALACPFLLALPPDARGGDWVAGPRVALFAAGGRRDALRTYLAAVPARAEGRREAWWSGPEYCTWGDQCYASQAGGSDVGSLTSARLAAWLAELDAARITVPTVLLDAGWWQLPPSTVRDLQAKGKRVVLWTQPHWQPDRTQHADWAMHDSAGRPVAYDAGNWVLDYTVPAVRKHMAAGIASYLGADGWNADGLKLDFPYTAAPVWMVHRDPSWGAGEAYRARVLRWWYATTKSVRHDALLTLGCANPLFGQVQDVCRLNEDWFNDPELFRRRAETVLALGWWVNCDDWNAYASYLDGQACERVVWGTFTLMSALWRGDERNARTPLNTAWQRRLSALTQLARRAPVVRGQRARYDIARGVCERRDSDGRIVAAALRLAGEPKARCLAVREGATWLVAATAAGTVTVPVGARVTRVQAVRHDGTRTAANYAAAGSACALSVADAASDVAWYEIETAPPL